MSHYYKSIYSRHTHKGVYVSYFFAQSYISPVLCEKQQQQLMPKTAAATKDGDCIASRVRAMRKQTGYKNVNTITSYFGRKRGPKTKYANKKKKARKLNANKKNDILDLSEDEMSTGTEKSSSDNDSSACLSKTSNGSPKVDTYSDTGNSDSDSNTVATSKIKKKNQRPVSIGRHQNISQLLLMRSRKKENLEEIIRMARVQEMVTSYQGHLLTR